MIILLQSVTMQFRRLFWHVLYHKVRQSNFITKCDRLLLQGASGITKCDRLSLQNASGITKCDTLYYKVPQVLQSMTVITKWDVTLVCCFCVFNVTWIVVLFWLLYLLYFVFELFSLLAFWGKRLHCSWMVFFLVFVVVFLGFVLLSSLEPSAVGSLVGCNVSSLVVSGLYFRLLNFCICAGVRGVLLSLHWFRWFLQSE